MSRPSSPAAVQFRKARARCHGDGQSEEMTNYVALSHSKMTKARTMATSCLLVGLLLLLLLLVPQTTTSPAAQQLPDWTPSSAEIQSETTTTTTTINDVNNVTDYQPPPLPAPPPHARPIVIPCPVDCVCKNSETVDCRGAGIRNISASFLSNQRVTKL